LTKCVPPKPAPPQPHPTSTPNRPPTKIFSYLAVQIDNDNVGSHRRRFRSYNIFHPFDFLCGVSSHDFGCEYPKLGTPGLVTSEVHRAYARAYYHHEFVTYEAYSPGSAEALRERVIDEKTGVGALIRKLHVELAPRIHYRGTDFFEEGFEVGKDSDDPDASPVHVVPFFDTLAAAIPKLPRLERLIINLQSSYRSNGEVGEELDSDEDYENIDWERHGPKLNLQVLQSLRNGIVNVFSLPDNGLQCLTYLRLELPCAYDFSVIAENISDTMALGLRHLYLEYVDGTGPGGDLQYTRSADPYGPERDDGSAGYPYSNLQRKHPNVLYMAHICALVQRCRNLESWGFEGTQCLELSTLEWQPAGAGLKVVDITRATTTCEKLLQLFKSADGNVSRLEAVQLKDVRLLDGTWADVFKGLGKCADGLKYFYVYNLVYAKEWEGGESAHLASHNNRPWENISVLWSESHADHVGLCEVLKQVKLRGGRMSGVMEEHIRETEDDDP
jgi:hypothetical protein